MKHKEWFGYIRLALFPPKEKDLCAHSQREVEKLLKLPEHDGLNIDWPTGLVDVLSINEVIEESRHSSLREAVARYIIFESECLWKNYCPENYNTHEYRTPQDIAINQGYYWAGNSILRVSQFYNDQGSSAGLQADLITRASSSLDITDIRKVFERETKRGLESLKQDPTGKDAAICRLILEQRTMGDIYQEYADKLELPEYPRLVGLKRGILRYQDVYRQAVEAGAKPDKN